MHKVLSVIVFLIVSSNLCSASSLKNAGTATAQFLKLGAGARAAAMGDAYGGISDDATAVYWNPAGLNQISRKTVSAMCAVWFEDIFYNWVSYVHPVEGTGTFGLGIQYLTYGYIRETDETGLEGSNFEPKDLAVTGSYARKISGISIGMNVKYISSKIKESAVAFAFDIGGMYKLMDDKLSVGLVIHNVGTKMKFVEEEGDPLPMNINLSGAYSLKDNWIVAADVNTANDNGINFGGGTEYSYKLNENISVAGRAGYNTKTKYLDGLRGITAGLGVKYKFLDIDYAYVPYGDLGDTHRISFSVKF